MGNIKWGRVFLGGLLAGFVANVLLFTANTLYLRAEWSSAGEWAPTGVAQHVALFILILGGGVLSVSLYAIIRLWQGSGPRTAALAGLIFWMLAWLYPVTLWSLSGGLPSVPVMLWATHLSTHLGLPSVPVMLWATHLSTHLLVAIVQTEVGAWVYKQEPGAPSYAEASGA